jgi:hypothetical protein
MTQATGAITVPTSGKGLYEITAKVAAWVRQQGLRTGLLTLFVQHTSASLTIQENADPDVRYDTGNSRGASRQACHAGGHAGRATQSRALRAFPRHPPPRLAAWHAGLRAPPPPAAALVGHAALVGQAFQPAAGFRAGLGAPFTHRPLFHPIRSASLRQPCDILATLCSSAGRRTSGDSGPSFSCCCFLWPPPPKTLLPPAP